MAGTAGHVFLMRGDIRRLACDAWLLPCDGAGRIEPTWVAWPPGASRGLGPPLPFPHWTQDAKRVRRLEGWPSWLPEPWLVHVELDSQVPSSWIVEGMAAFVREAGREIRGRRPRYGRTAPLLAVPVGVAGVGAAEGQRARRAAGALVQELLPELRGAARYHGVDVAIVAHSDDSAAAAHAARLQEAGTRWEGLPQRLRESMAPAADAVRRGALMLVSGSRLSERCGVPSWSRLLERLAEAQGAPEDWRVALAKLPQEERTRRVASLFDDTVSFGQAAAERLTLPNHGLSHGLAAALRPAQLLTLAADDLFDQALSATGQRPDVVLDGPHSPGGTPVVKLRGAPANPTSLWWARCDPIRRAEREQVAAAVAQAAIRPDPHVLLIGFSPGPALLKVLELIVPAVPAVPQGRDARITVLAEQDDPAFVPLLPPGVAWVPLVQSASGERVDVRQAGRRLELLLDGLGGSAAVHARPLDPAIRGVLPTADQSLARAVDDFVAGLPARALEGEAWKALRAWLLAQGHPCQ